MGKLVRVDGDWSQDKPPKKEKIDHDKSHHYNFPEIILTQTEPADYTTKGRKN